MAYLFERTPLETTRRLINELLSEKDTLRKKKNLMKREIAGQTELIEEVKNAVYHRDGWYLGTRYLKVDLAHLQRELTLLTEINSTL